MSFYIFCKNNIFRGDIAGSSYRKCGSTMLMHSISTVGLYFCKISFWHFDFSTRLYARIYELFCVSFRILSYRKTDSNLIVSYTTIYCVFCCFVWGLIWKNYAWICKEKERVARLINTKCRTPCEEMPVIIRLFRGLFILLPWFFYTVTVLNIA